MMIDSPRIRTVKQHSRQLMATFADDCLTPVVEQFSCDLLAALEQPLRATTTPQTVPKIKEKIWKEYVAIRANKLPAMWNEFLSKINCVHITSEPLLMEIINETIFQDLLLKMF